MSEWLRKTPVALLAIVVALAACGQDRGDGAATDEEALKHTDLTVAQFREMIAERDFVLVNVHIPFVGDIPGTDESIPFDEIGEHLDKLPQDQGAKIVLYCRSGGMSAEAAATLASLGYTNVFDLLGGMRAWKAAGYEIEGTPKP